MELAGDADTVREPRSIFMCTSSSATPTEPSFTDLGAECLESTPDRGVLGFAQQSRALQHRGMCERAADIVWRRR
jgi:hypothetical protein